MVYLLASFTAAIFHFHAVLSKPLSPTIIDCEDLQCSASVGTPQATDTCTIMNNMFASMGFARIPATQTVLSGLSWTEGVAVASASGQRSFDNSFYLGTPAFGNLADVGAGGCALFFNQVTDRVAFGDKSCAAAQGTCQEAMSPECVNALIKWAMSVTITGLRASQVCSRLESIFKNNLEPACGAFSLGNNWTGISAKALTGSTVALPISAAENSTSKCWPVVPKDYDLTCVSSTTSVGDFSAGTLGKNFNSITPILTLFYPLIGGLLPGFEAQMTCSKTIQGSSALNDTKTTPKNYLQVNSVELLGSENIFMILALSLLALALILD